MTSKNRLLPSGQGRLPPPTLPKPTRPTRSRSPDPQRQSSSSSLRIGSEAAENGGAGILRAKEHRSPKRVVVSKTNSGTNCHVQFLPAAASTPNGIPPHSNGGPGSMTSSNGGHFAEGFPMNSRRVRDSATSGEYRQYDCVDSNI